MTTGERVGFCLDASLSFSNHHAHPSGHARGANLIRGGRAARGIRQRAVCSRPAPLCSDA